MKKKLKKQPWILITDEDAVYDHIIIPKWDIKPHALKVKKTKKGLKAELAGHDCPCKPEVEIDGDMLIIRHNSFRDIERMENSLKEIKVIE